MLSITWLTENPPDIMCGVNALFNTSKCSYSSSEARLANSSEDFSFFGFITISFFAFYED
jgi:hypothetical protein